MDTAKTIDQVKEALTPLADKLGEGASFVYATYVRQAIVDGILLVAIPTIVGVVLLIAGRRWHKHWSLEVKQRKSNYAEAKEEHAKGIAESRYVPTPYRYEFDIDDAQYTLYVPVGVLAICWLILTLVCIPMGIQHLANPHYYAIQNLLQTVRG